MIIHDKTIPEKFLPTNIPGKVLKTILAQYLQLS
jgi:hypothetical protein